MNYEKLEEIESLNIDDFIWYIYIFIIAAALYSNKIEKEFIVTNDHKKHDEFHSINLVVLTIAFFIYIYFIFNNFKVYKKRRDSSSLLNLIASILFIIGGGILLFTEFNNIGSNINNVEI